VSIFYASVSPPTLSNFVSPFAQEGDSFECSGAANVIISQNDINNMPK
jgi:hypothetical protein